MWVPMIEDRQRQRSREASKLNDEIWSLVRSRQLPAAVERCHRLNDQHSEFVPGWLLASHLALELGESTRALKCVERAIHLSGESAQSLLLKANGLRAQHRHTDALACAEKAAERQDCHAGIYGQLGLFYTNACRYERALDMYQKAVHLDPSNVAHLFNRATVRRFLGDLAGAESDYNKVIAHDPRDCEAYFNRSELRRQCNEHNHTEELERLLDGGIGDWRGAVQIHYALAKEYEDLESYGLAFKQFEMGAKLRRQHLQYDVRQDVHIMSAIMEAFTPDMLSRAPRTAVKPRKKPILIFGLPRSGTTLVERILGCHSNVSPAGELDEFAASLVAVVSGTSGSRVPAIDLVRKSAQCDFSELGRIYLERVAHLTGDTAHFTDKMPLNFLYCGLVSLSLPEAKLIHVRRQPMAVCFAMYKTLFKQGYPCSYTVEEIGEYYVAYRALMDHWQRLFPERILTIGYEQLVLHQREETQRMLDFCDLPWEEACLDFHKSVYPSSTASASQVRRPLYRSSLNMWRKYGADLAPLKQSLMRAGVREDELEMEWAESHSTGRP